VEAAAGTSGGPGSRRRLTAESKWAGAGKSREASKRPERVEKQPHKLGKINIQNSKKKHARDRRSRVATGKSRTRDHLKQGGNRPSYYAQVCKIYLKQLIYIYFLSTKISHIYFFLKKLGGQLTPLTPM